MDFGLFRSCARHINSPNLFDATYQRYLLNAFRAELPFRDIPIKLYLRARSRTELAMHKAQRPRASEPVPPAEPAQEAPQPAWVPEEVHVSDLDREVNELLADLDE